MDWVVPFYELQHTLCDVAPSSEQLRDRMALVQRHRARARTLLDIGAGSGEFAAAACEEGLHVAAIELSPSRAEAARRLAPRAHILEADMYTAPLAGTFDVVTVWDGFGVGDDDAQRLLLGRIAGWLARDGVALVDVYAPWFWAAQTQKTQHLPTASRRYGYDAHQNRLLDTWWPAGQPLQARTQSLRCYAPADLTLLLEGTALQLTEVVPGAGPDGDGRWVLHTDLASAHAWCAVLRPS